MNLNRMMSRKDISDLTLSISRVGGKVAVSFMIKEEKISDMEVLRRMYPSIDYFCSYKGDFITRPDYGEGGPDYEEGRKDYFDETHKFFCEGVFTIVINKQHTIRVSLEADQYEFGNLYNIVLKRLLSVTDEIDAWLDSEPDIDLRIPIKLD